MGLILRNLPVARGVRTRTYLVDTYILTTNVQDVNEGLEFSVNLTTTNVPNGTLVPYTITGVTSDDLYGAPLTGNFVVGSAETTTFLTSQDFVTEGPEYATISLDNGKSSAEILINDTATEYDPYRSMFGTSLLINGEDYGTAQSTVFTDTSSNNTAFTVQGSNPYVRGTDLYNTKYSYNFAGPAGYLAFNYNPAYDIGTQDASVELFVRFTAVPTSNQVFNGQNSGSGVTLRHAVWSDGRLFASVNSDAGVVAYGPTVEVGKWYHCVLTYSAQEQTVRYFVNGMLFGVKTGVASIPGRNEAYYVGNDDSALNLGFTGQLSCFRYVVGEIPVEYRTTSTTVGSLVFAFPGVAPEPTAKTVLMTACTPYIEDISSYKNRHTNNGCTSSLITPFAPPEKYQYGFGYFDGAGMVYNDTSATLNFGTAPFTFETWVMFSRLDVGASAYYVVAEAANTSGAFLIYKNNTTNDLVYARNGGTTRILISNADIRANQWYHIAIVRESTAAGKARVYINGRLKYTYTDADNYSITGVSLGGRKGSLYTPGFIGPTRAVKGQALYSADFVPAPMTAVTGTSLLLNFQNLAITDKSGLRLPINDYWSTTPSTTIKKYGSRSLYFNGTNRLDLPYRVEHNLTGDFTIELWLYADNAAKPTGSIINFGGVDSLAYASYLLYKNGAKIGFLSSFDNASYAINGTITLDLPSNQWAHIAVTRSGNVWRGYMNGIKTWETTVSGTPYTPTGRNLRIGAYANTTWTGATYNGLNGYIDDLRITKGVARYTSAVFAPPARLPTK